VSPGEPKGTEFGLRSAAAALSTFAGIANLAISAVIDQGVFRATVPRTNPSPILAIMAILAILAMEAVL
jgi:hypothetical protein